jgi:hypothetical protein
MIIFKEKWIIFEDKSSVVLGEIFSEMPDLLSSCKLAH